MAYVKTTWATGDVITAEKMNNIEDGIANNDGAVRYDVEQTLTDVQKVRARMNIGGANSEDVTSLKSAIYPYNARNVLSPYPNGHSTFNGITWTWNGDVCSYSGTATGTSFTRLFWVDRYTMPSWMTPGKTYAVEYATTDSNVTLSFIFYKNGNILAERIANSTIDIPSDAQGVQIRFKIDSGSTVNGTITAKIISTMPNQEIAEKGFFNRGVLPTGSDLDDVKISGCYVLNGTYTYTHTPLPSGSAGTLLVFASSANTIEQLVTSLSGVIFLRTSYLSEFQSAWMQLNESEFKNRGVLASGTDLNTVKTGGYYVLNSSNAYTNSPFATGMGGTLIVYPSSANTVLQMAVRSAENTRLWVRTSLLGTFQQDWTAISGDTIYNNNYNTTQNVNTYNVTATPAITTDTNNFLSSTGDTTDRTADIQAMLATGSCILGTGVFYVSGVTIPAYARLKGQGASTQLILKSDVTDGAAVYLDNFTELADMRIRGNTSNITPSSVGTRHGIMFEANGDAATNPTYKYNAIVDNVFIFDFTGGGITCRNTGITVDQCVEVTNAHIKRCGAGVNVFYRSEFHHFTNINATSCYIGCVCNGGNCLFSNCNFSGNTIGILIDNEFNQSPNNAHGVFSCCKVAHSGGNTGVGIKVIGSILCENFNGISFDYGHIVIEKCKGVQFTGCRIGRNTVIEITDSTATIFDACIIRDTSTVTVTNTNSVTHFANCYDSATGDIYNPLA